VVELADQIQIVKANWFATVVIAEIQIVQVAQTVIVPA
jgi:hypothetical protein